MELSKRNSRKRPRTLLLQSTESVELLPRSISGPPVTATGLIERSQKATTACETCRFKKVKCNEGRPSCTYCSRRGFKCDYPQQELFKHDQDLKILLERLAQTDRRLNQLEVLHNASDQCSDLNETYARFPSISTSSSHSREWHECLESGASLNYTWLSPATTINLSLDLALVDDRKRSQYLGRTPICCEEDRQPFPNALDSCISSDVQEIPCAREKFFPAVGALYPLVCQSTLCKAADAVEAEGFQENMRSCFVLLVIAVVKAFTDVHSTESGLADFQRAMQLRSRLSAQLNLQYVHVLVFTAIFLFRKDRILDFVAALHCACTMLRTVIQRDQLSGIQRPKIEKNNIRLLFWICHSLERDVIREIDSTFPHSDLSRFEELFPLPLPCEEADNKDRPPHVNTYFVFFMAEMSLRSILENILTTPELENCTRESPRCDQSACRPRLSPVVQELRSQLDTWILHLPANLDWSVEPACGMLTEVATRMKLLYWYARFVLYRPMMLRTLEDETLQSHLLSWEPFREGLLPALNLVKAYVAERPDVDVMMADRIISAIEMLKKTAAKAPFAAVNGERVRDVLQNGTELLFTKFAKSSEWVLCKLYNMHSSSY